MGATTGANGDYCEVWPAEAGHSEVAPRAVGSDQIEYELMQFLQIKYSAKARVSTERVVSGRGLANIYEFLAWKFPAKVNQKVHKEFIGPPTEPGKFEPSVISSAASKENASFVQEPLAFRVVPTELLPEVLHLSMFLTGDCS